MHTESLDVLERASVAPAQARAIARAIEIEIAGAKRSDMALQFAELRSEMAAHVAELRGEIVALGAAIRVEVAQQFGELRKEISSVTRQMYVALLGQTAVMLGFFYFFSTELR